MNARVCAFICLSQSVCFVRVFMYGWVVGWMGSMTVVIKRWMDGWKCICTCLAIHACMHASKNT